MSDRVVTLYSQENCQQCMASERALNGKKIDFVHDEAQQEDNLAYIKALGHMRAPVMTVVVDGILIDHWSGFRPDKIGELAA